MQCPNAGFEITSYKIARVSREFGGPKRFAFRYESREIHRGGRESTLGVGLKYGEIFHARFQYIFTQRMLLVGCTACLGKASQKVKRGHAAHTKIEFDQHASFHVQNLLGSVGIVANVYKVADFRRVNLFKLGGNQRARNAHELEFIPVHNGLRQIAIQKTYGEVECIRQHSEFEIHTHQPVNENDTHLVTNVNLVLHVGGRHPEYGLVHTFMRFEKANAG